MTQGRHGEVKKTFVQYNSSLNPILHIINGQVNFNIK